MLAPLLQYPSGKRTTDKKNTFFQPANHFVQRQKADDLDEMNKNFNRECMFTDQEGIKRIRRNSYYCMSLLGQIDAEEKKKNAAENPEPERRILEDLDWDEMMKQNTEWAEKIFAELIRELEKSDTNTFLNRLRNLTETERKILLNHIDLNKRLRKYFSPETILSVKLILIFGNKTPESIRKLKIAVQEKNIQEIKNIILFYDDIRADNFEISRELIEKYFANDSRKDDLLFYYLTVLSSSEHYNEHQLKNVHYEKDTETGTIGLKEYTAASFYRIVRDLSSFYVFVPMNFVDEEMNTLPFGLTKEDDKIMQSWLDGIRQYWNNKFIITNAEATYPLIFKPYITEEGYPIRVVRNAKAEKERKKDKDWRTNVSEWEIKESKITAAHEFGHLLGNPDEYELPGKIADIPAKLKLSEKEKIKTTVEGKGGNPSAGKYGYTYNNLMGNGTEVLLRHVVNIVSDINAYHLQTDEKPFNAAKK